MMCLQDRMLQTMVPAKDIEDVEIMKHRYDGFEKEMNANASRVAVVNQLARQLLHVEHPNSEQIVARQNQVQTHHFSHEFCSFLFRILISILTILRLSYLKYAIYIF